MQKVTSHKFEIEEKIIVFWWKTKSILKQVKKIISLWKECLAWFIRAYNSESNGIAKKGFDYYLYAFSINDQYAILMKN